jgi:hypothetical protein
MHAGGLLLETKNRTVIHNMLLFDSRVCYSTIGNVCVMFDSSLPLEGGGGYLQEFFKSSFESCFVKLNGRYKIQNCLNHITFN